MSRALHFRKQLRPAGPPVVLLRCAALYPGLHGTSGFAERTPSTTFPCSVAGERR